MQIKQYHTVTFLGCALEEKINFRRRFLYWRNRLLLQTLRRLLCNALMQPHFNYACSAWYPNLNSRLKLKLQILQNKCIRFYLNWNSRAHKGFTEFEKINWLPINARFEQCVCSMTFKCFNTWVLCIWMMYLNQLVKILPLLGLVCLN